MQTIEQIAKLYKDADEEVKAAELKRSKYKVILEEMRAQVEAALGIEKKPVYRTLSGDNGYFSIGGDGR